MDNPSKIKIIVSYRMSACCGNHMKRPTVLDMRTPGDPTVLFDAH